MRDAASMKSRNPWISQNLNLARLHSKNPTFLGIYFSTQQILTIKLGILKTGWGLGHLRTLTIHHVIWTHSPSLLPPPAIQLSPRACSSRGWLSWFKVNGSGFKGVGLKGPSIWGLRLSDLFTCFPQY